MKRIAWLALIFLVALHYSETVAQKKSVTKKTQVQKPPEKKTPRTVDPVADEKRVRELVTFFEYMLNTLGSSSTSSRDKEVLVTQSYAKIFRDSKVQVEDDLDEERKVVTNKDIVAYLKDVDFFFKDIKFELPIEEIKANKLQSGELFYKVSLRRTMTGTTVENKPINVSGPRYIEVNYNPTDQDLKIVSIYTNQINEKEALTNWWSELSYEWQSIFKKQINVVDSVQYNDIKKVSLIQKLDLSNNQYIRDIEPLIQLSALQSLDLSGTSISDISPIRNLTELVFLNLSNTRVTDLTPLRYAINLRDLNVTRTGVSTITVVERMSTLEKIDLTWTSVSDFTPITSLASLQEINAAFTKLSDLTPFEKLFQLGKLNVTGTQVSDLSPIRNLKNIMLLDLDSTRVSKIEPISQFNNLKILQINYTAVADVSALKGLEKLEKVYCDQTRISREAAAAFMATNPKVLIIYDSKDLKAWWDVLSPEWQKLLSKAAAISSVPSKEELARIPLLDSIDLDEDKSIKTLDPLEKLINLKSIDASKTSITDLSPLREHSEIIYLNISETQVRDLSPISHFKKIKVLWADKSKIENIEQLEIPSLEKLYADQTTVQDVNAREFIDKNQKCLLVYKTIHLNRWWSSLSGSWKYSFKNQAGMKSESREDLHRLIESESLQLKDVSVSNWKPLSEFIRLRELSISGGAFTSISALENLKSLRHLSITQSPLQKIDSIHFYSELEELDISNTPIEDIYPVWKLKNLKTLNCAGTQVRRLDALEKLEKLEYFDCSNTFVSRISPLDYLPLKTLKCYNTKISTRAIENFKASHPDCNVMFYR